MEADESIVTSEADETRQQERLSVVATFGILAATIAATVAGSLAALASFHADGADAQRLAWATYSNELLLASNTDAATQGARANARVEEAWRAEFLSELAAHASDPAVGAALAAEAPSASGAPAPAPGASAPTFASPDPASWCRGLSEPYDCAYEVASAYAETSLDDNRQERAYIACVSLLAIALFLFALSKMLSQPSMEKLFIGLGALITLVAVGWMVAEPFTTPAPSPSGAAVRSYERGWQLEQRGGPAATVEALLSRATTEDPSLADAWQQLGDAEVFDGPGGRPGRACPQATADLRRAWQLRGAPEDLDRLAVDQVLCGQPAAALDELAVAGSDPSDVLAPPSLALAELAAGRTRPALRTLDAAVRRARAQGSPASGPVFMTYWFDQLFDEVRVLEARPDRPPGLGAFVARLQHDEARATLADFGLRAPAPAPRAAVWASLALAAPGDGVVGGVVPVTVELQYAHLRPGDVILVVWHRPGTLQGIRLTSLALPDDSVLVVGRPGGPTPGVGYFAVPAPGYVAPGRYQIDVTLDAVPMSKPQSVTVPEPSGSGGGCPVQVPSSVPLSFGEGPALAFTC